jgi:hypothetical protein
MRAAGIRAADSPAVGIRAGRNRAGDSPAGRTPEVGIRAGRIRAADNPAADSPAAGMVVDQAIRAAVQVGPQVVPSPVNAPDVVAHEPILSTGGAFLNVPPVSVA